MAPSGTDLPTHGPWLQGCLGHLLWSVGASKGEIISRRGENWEELVPPTDSQCSPFLPFVLPKHKTKIQVFIGQPHWDQGYLGAWKPTSSCNPTGVSLICSSHQPTEWFRLTSEARLLGRLLHWTGVGGTVWNIFFCSVGSLFWGEESKGKREFLKRTHTNNLY